MVLNKVETVGGSYKFIQIHVEVSLTLLFLANLIFGGR